MMDGVVESPCSEARKPYFTIQLPPRQIGNDPPSSSCQYKHTNPRTHLPAFTPPHGIASWPPVIATEGPSEPVSPMEPSASSMEPSADHGSSSGKLSLQLPSRDPADSSLQPSNNTLLEAVSTAVSNLNLIHPPNSTFRVISQILPCPMHEDEEASPTTTYRTLIASLQSSPSESARWVQVTHALPEHCALKEMPTSPPTTPSAIAKRNKTQQDYFNTNLMINNVSIMVDRHNVFDEQDRIIASSPGLATPPSTADISLYERIIPPSTLKEFEDLFEPAGPSSLVDRLTELATNGHLILVYPTKAGANAFQQSYLSPALDPLLRNVVYSNNLPSSTCATLGHMAAVPHMLPFQSLKSKVARLLTRLATKSTLDPTPGSVPTYSLVYAKQGQVEIQRNVWEHWWVKQEAPRVRSIMDTCLKHVGNRPFYKDEHFTARGLAREVLDGLVARGAEEGAGSADAGSARGDSIEVGVFVIKRTA